MAQQAVLTDASVVLGRLAVQLAQGQPVAAALSALVEDLGLTSAAVRSGPGRLEPDTSEVGPTGLPVRTSPSTDPGLAFPLAGASRRRLIVLGSDPAQRPVLQAAAAILGLALGPRADQLLEAAEQDLDELADTMHDGPLQSLVVARYAADAAVRGGDPLAARDAVQQALVDVRRVLWHVRPRGAAGLLASLQVLSTQLADSGGHPIDLVGDLAAAALFTGPRATLAFRLVQAVAQPNGPPVRVVVCRGQGQLVLDVEGARTLPSPERWLLRVRAVAGDLSASPGGLRLALPLHPSTTNARTDT